MLSRNATPICLHGVCEAPLAADFSFNPAMNTYDFGSVAPIPLIRVANIPRGHLVEIHTAILTASIPEDVFVDSILSTVDVNMFSDGIPMFRHPIAMNGYHPFDYQGVFLSNSDQTNISVGIGGKLNGMLPAIIGHSSIKIRVTLVGHEYDDQELLEMYLAGNTGETASSKAISSVAKAAQGFAIVDLSNPSVALTRPAR